MGEERRGGARHRRLTITAVIVGCLGLLGVAVFREAPASQAVEFIPVGHWVYHVADESAYHVDGSTGQVDARVSVPGAEQDSQVAQGDGSGFVVERKRITIFDSSTLHVEDAVDAPAAERPVVLEVAGGPYLVYRNAGQVVRLGDPMATVAAGGPVTDPVATRDGTVWLHRIDTGALCTLPRGATRLSCPARVEQRHQGRLTVVGDRAALVDTTADTVSLVHDDGLGTTRPLGFDAPASARVAASDAGGRLALLDTEHGTMHLVDTAGLDGRPESAPVEVELPADGEFVGPVAAADVVAVVNTAGNELLTYDSTGEHRETTRLPDKEGEPRLVSGEDDRIYVDSPDGSHVLVVDGSDGSVLDVPVVVDDPESGEEPGASEEEPDSQALPQGPPSTERPADEPRKQREEPRRERTPADEPPADTPPPVVASATPPGAPGAVSAVAGHRSATVRWRAAADNGAPVTAYHLSWPGGSTRVAGSAGQATVTGLANGTAYAIAVAAENSAGRGPAVSAAAVIPLRAAAAPAVNIPAQFGLQPVTWNRPELYGGTLVHYVVSVTGQADQTTAEPSLTLTSFANSGATVTVRAVTRFGSRTVTGEPGSATVPNPVDFPSVKITRVAWVVAGGDRLAVTVDVTAESTPTCEVSVVGGGNASGPCSGTTTLTVPGVTANPATGAVQVSVTASTTSGFASVPVSWLGTPEPAGGGGGVVLWLGPGVLAASHWWTNRRRREERTR
ncbi:fibronectin type III domain-containing protein [Actinophytocola sp. NPDC049390]|uniref:fibronectin type III domain-containing protein n=1 Tax=Actinophytocola sp. NPDC049390 TaxID=3363894 RepID=UPI0037B2BFF7